MSRDPILAQRTLDFFRAALQTAQFRKSAHKRRALDALKLEFEQDDLINRLKARIDRELDHHDLPPA